MQGKEIIILQSRIAALEQYNQHLLEQNKALKGLVKEYMKFLTTLITHKEEEEYEKVC